MKKIGYVLLVIVNLLFFSCKEKNNRRREAVENKKIPVREKSIDLEGQDIAYEDYQKVKQLFDKGKKSPLLKAKDYPKYYGGSYINTQNKFVILITGDTIIAKEIIGQIVNNKNTIYLHCEYSYTTLNEIMDQIGDAAENKLPVCQYLDSWRIQETENRVYVELNKFDEVTINEFKKCVVNSPAVVFKKSQGKIIYD